MGATQPAYNHLLTTDDRAIITGKNCFDFLRYLLAISLIIAHFCTLTETDQFWWITGGMRVKGFFIITGFLVSYSFLSRNGHIKTYCKKRVARIIPAYLCAIIIGWIIGLCCTNDSIVTYLQEKETWKYLAANLSMLNWIQPSLPGVFTNNFMSPINGSLWSMKWEVIFYLVTPALIYLIARWNKKAMVVLITIGIVIINGISCPIQIKYFTYFFAGLIGLLLFRYFYSHKWVFLLSGTAAALVLKMTGIAWLSNALEPILFAIILLGIAYTFTFLSFVRKCANVTYGLYLYHFPVIQVLISLGLAKYNVWLCFGCALIITFALANASWFLIEKPLMDQYK